MTVQLQALAITVFAVVMAAAAFEDFRRLVIPNLLPILLCAVWPLYLVATGPSMADALEAIGCALAVFLVGAVLFARGWLGGGDVKLLAAATLWTGPGGTLQLLLLTAVLGGGLALFFLMPLGNQAATAARVLLGRPLESAKSGLAMPVPYGVAIAGAALIVILSPHLG